MRIVVFTLNPDIDRSPWWSIVLAAPGVRAVLVCRQVPSRHPRDVLRRLRRNVVKHGLIFLPYRVGVLVRDVLRRLVAPAVEPPKVAPPDGVACDLLETTNLHAPDILTRIRDWRPDLGISLGAPILRPSLFQIPRLGTVNLHLGRLPDFRGAPPGFWELYTGARQIGATVHWMNEGLDTGPVIARAEAPIYAADSLVRVEARATELGKKVCAEALSRIAAGTAAGTPQEPGGQTFRSPTLTQRARLAARLAGRRVRRGIGGPRSVAKRAAALGALGVVRPLRDLFRTVTRTHPVRVFTFHRVSDLCRDAMTVSPAVFRRQVAYIKRYHDVVPLERALELLGARARLRRPLAVLCFDDGYRSVFDEAWPVMRAQGVVGTCFVCTDFVGTDRRFPHDDTSPVRPHLDVMDWQELEALNRAGWTVGGHTATHARLSLCGDPALRDELARPLATLRERLDLPAVTMAYPFGGVGDVPRGFAGMARQAGYVACLSNFGGENSSGVDRYDLRRIEVGGDHPGLAWRAFVQGIDLGRWREWWDRSFIAGRMRSA